jgi:hypothetical protein
MGASHSVEPDVHEPDIEVTETDIDPEIEYDTFEEKDDIQWLWPFI